MKKFQIGILIILVAVVGFVVWYNISQKTELATTSQPLRIGLNPWIGNGLYYVAKEKGFFDAEKINVALEPFDDGAVGKQLLNANKIDVLPITPETGILLADSGTKIKMVGMTVTSEGADGVIAAQQIQKLSDLRGKKVAFEVGSPSHFLLSYFLDNEGITTNDLVVVNSTAPDAGAAFLAGQVDAAVTWEPWLSKAIERPGGHVLIDSKSLTLFPDMMYVRDDVVNERSQDVRALLRALFSAIDFISQNENEAATIIAKNFKITNPEVKEQLATIRWLSYEDNIESFAKNQPNDLLQKAADLWLKLGLVKNKIDGNSLVDDSLLKNLYK